MKIFNRFQHRRFSRRVENVWVYQGDVYSYSFLNSSIVCTSWTLGDAFSGFGLSFPAYSVRCFVSPNGKEEICDCASFLLESLEFLPQPIGV